MQENYFSLIDLLQLALANCFKIDAIQWASAPLFQFFRMHGAKAPDSPEYPINSQLKLTAINIPSFAANADCNKYFFLPLLIHES